jgi:hypothetical protein
MTNFTKDALSEAKDEPPEESLDSNTYDLVKDALYESARPAA